MELQEPTKTEIKRSSALNDRADQITITQNETPRAKTVVEILKECDIDENTKLLDIGCGSGTALKLIEKEFGCKGRGLDIYHKAENIVNFDLNSGKMPYEDQSFDFVVCMDVIEHLFHPNFVLREIKRVLKDDGQTIICLPNTYDLRSRLLFLFGKTGRGFDTYGHHYFLTLDVIRAFVKEEFHILKARYMVLSGCRSKWITRLFRWTGKESLYITNYFMLCEKEG